MGCPGCGSSSVLPGALTAQKLAIARQSKPKVQGYSGSGVQKSQIRLLRDSKQSVVASNIDEEVK